MGRGHCRRRDRPARRGRHPVRVLGELQRLQVSRHDLVQAALVEVPDDGKRRSSGGDVTGRRISKPSEIQEIPIKYRRKE